MKRATRILLIALAASAALSCGIYRLFNPLPPDLLHQGYVTASFNFRDNSPANPALTVSSADPAFLKSFFQVIAHGTGATDCRCISLGTVTLTKSDGSTLLLHIKPSHSHNDCQVAIGPFRYSLDRKAFLAAVAPLGIPPERWTGE